MPHSKFACFLVIVGFLLSGCSGTPPASSGRSQAKFTQGQVLYIRYCADCHGWEGEGDGPATEMVDVRPPSLRNPKIFEQNTSDQFVSWVLEGRRTPVRIKHSTAADSEDEITALIEYMRSLPTREWAQVNQGQEVYDDLCINCHGLYGRGDGDFSQNLASLPRDLADPNYKNNVESARLLRFVKFGKGAMPGTVDILTDEERLAVLTFVNLFSQGFETYQRNCMVCHGNEGLPTELAYSDESMLEFDLRALPSFNTEYFETHTDQQIRPKVFHMLESSKITMPHFSDTLSSTQVSEIEAYLRNLQFVSP